MPNKYGLEECRLQDGACIVDVCIEADPESIVAKFGTPSQLFQGGKILVNPATEQSIACYAGKLSGLRWSVAETVAVTNDDYIVTMLRQAAAALRGEVLDLPAAYENGLGVARDLSAGLQTRAIILWGSDEWSGLLGGCILENGVIRRAVNICGSEAIAALIESRETMGDEEDENDCEDCRPVQFERDTGSQSYEGEVEDLLELWMQELEVRQPSAPLSLWGEWRHYDSVWGALKL